MAPSTSGDVEGAKYYISVIAVKGKGAAQTLTVPLMAGQGS